jgi:hypothetical protein
VVKTVRAIVMPMFQAKFLGDHGAPMARKRRATLHFAVHCLAGEATISRRIAKPTGEHHHIATIRAWPSYIAAQDMIRYPLYLSKTPEAESLLDLRPLTFPNRFDAGIPWSERNSHHHCDGHYPVNRVLHHVTLKPPGKRLSGELNHIQPIAAAQRCSSARSDSSIIRSSS